MELLKLLSANDIVAQMLCFFVVLASLKKFLWGKILGSLDARKEYIAGELKKVEGAKSEAEKTKAEYESKVALMRREAKKIIDDAKSEAGKVAEGIHRKAYEDAEAIVSNAKISMQHDLAKAKEALKDEIVAITIKAAENIIEEKLSEEQDVKLVEDFLKKMDNAA